MSCFFFDSVYFKQTLDARAKVVADTPRKSTKTLSCSVAVRYIFNPSASVYSRWCCMSLRIMDIVFLGLSLQCFDAVSWVAGRASGLKKRVVGVLAWFSVCSEVQTCMWPSWCHCHSLSLASVKSRLVLTILEPAHPFSPGKKAVKWVCVCVCDHINMQQSCK